uniref:Uncharacterized protein n=1 Tax=Cacopsylla melanoneura TaxID=428564 RepID=A0A8D8SPQ5_9HEMI
MKGGFDFLRFEAEAEQLLHLFLGRGEGVVHLLPRVDQLLLNLHITRQGLQRLSQHRLMRCLVQRILLRITQRFIRTERLFHRWFLNGHDDRSTGGRDGFIRRSPLTGTETGSGAVGADKVGVGVRGRGD